MKSFYRTMATKEDREKLPCVGKALGPGEKYNKDDFLTPAKVAKKFNMSTQEATEIMQKLYKYRKKFVLNNHLTDIVVSFSNDKRSLKLHPMAFDIFQNQITKQKD